jgi:ubiquinone/menaquinone biosynthesis C-methylase UbiE
MTKPRQPETDHGIQGEIIVKIYDTMQRHLRDKGWIETNEILKSGITSGVALELGPGPGYLGLEWLKKTHGTRLKGLDISADMVEIAKKNAQDYALEDRAEYIVSPGDTMPFDEGMFDVFFSNGSLHEWSKPEKTFSEIWRVLKKGGRIFISDLRRDMLFLIRWFLWLNTKPKAIRPGLLSSINAAYTPSELRTLIDSTVLKECEISANPFGLMIIGKKS